MNNENITIIKDPENPETTEILAAEIIKISEAFQELKKTRLKEWVIVDLLHSIIGRSAINKGDIQRVLRALPTLAESCVLKPKPVDHD